MDFIEYIGTLLAGLCSLFEGIGWLLSVADFILTLINLFAWDKSRDNRKERKLARRNGIPPPRRNRWTWLSTLLTPIVVVLVLCTLLVVVHRW